MGMKAFRLYLVVVKIDLLYFVTKSPPAPDHRG